MSKRNKILLLLITAIVLFIIFVFWFRNWLAIDKCLDSGGVWNYETKTCEPFIEREECESGGGRWNYDKGVCEYNEITKDK